VAADGQPLLIAYPDPRRKFIQEYAPTKRGKYPDQQSGTVMHGVFILRALQGKSGGSPIPLKRRILMPQLN
jgi:hypothetical protein